VADGKVRQLKKFQTAPVLNGSDPSALWIYGATTATLERIHHELYVRCREQAEREASPTAAIIDSQSVKSAEKGGPRSIRMATMQKRKSRVRSGMFL
jgi:hypothetical protein